MPTASCLMPDGEENNDAPSPSEAENPNRCRCQFDILAVRVCPPACLSVFLSVCRSVPSGFLAVSVLSTVRGHTAFNFPLTAEVPRSLRWLAFRRRGAAAASSIAGSLCQCGFDDYGTVTRRPHGRPILSDRRKTR